METDKDFSPYDNHILYLVSSTEAAGTWMIAL